MSRCRFTHLTRSGGGTRSPDIFILVQLRFQPWNVSSTGLQIWKQFGATLQFMQNCQSVAGAPGQILNRTRGVLLFKHAHRTTYDNAWVREHLLISSWQPALNHPFISKFPKLKPEGWMMQLRKNRYKVLLFRARGCIKEFDDACFLSDRCRHLISFKNKLGEFCTKLACSQERALKHASEFYLENFIPWKFMLCTDWRLT